MLLFPEQLVEQIHDSPTRITLAATGGGSRAIADLLETPGGSRTLLEAVVPYSTSALIAWLGGKPDEFCSAATARAMAMAAFHRARKLEESSSAPLSRPTGEGPGVRADRDSGELGYVDSTEYGVRSAKPESLNPEATPHSVLCTSYSSRTNPSALRPPPSALPLSLAGVACSASLASDRPKRGSHRIHAAMQTDSVTAAWHLELRKDRRTRAEEERLAGRLLLNVVAEACGVSDRLPLDLVEGERVECSRVEAPAEWQALLLGYVEFVQATANSPLPLGEGQGVRAEGAVDSGQWTVDSGKKVESAEWRVESKSVRENPPSALRLPPSSSPCVLFPGAFNPLHEGHRRMFQLAQEMLQEPAAWEISILNVDKPPLDYLEIERRIRQFPADQAVYLSRAATFEEKSRLFAGATFVVGADTLPRIAAPQYYGGSVSERDAALKRIAQRGCRFLAFGRDVGNGFAGLGDFDLPEALRAICREVPPEIFQMAVSSSGIRKTGG